MQKLVLSFTVIVLLYQTRKRSIFQFQFLQLLNIFEKCEIVTLLDYVSYQVHNSVAFFEQCYFNNWKSAVRQFSHIIPKVIYRNPIHTINCQSYPNKIYITFIAESPAQSRGTPSIAGNFIAEFPRQSRRTPFKAQTSFARLAYITSITPS